MSFLQTEYWARFKSRFGWTYSTIDFSKTNYLDTNLKNDDAIKVFVLHRKIAKFFSLSYIPLAPNIFETSLENNTLEDEFFLFQSFIKEVKKTIPKNTLFLRFDLPPFFSSLDNRKVFLERFFKEAKKQKIKIHKAKADIQTPDTVLLDLEQDEQKLLENMKAKWRYNIRLAEKRGVIVNEVGESGLDDFYALYEETAKRDSIAIHSHEYYKSLFELATFYPHIKLSLYIAKHEDDILSSIICLFTKDEAVYLYGSSSNTKRNLMSTYLLQWKAIQDAKEFGSKRYDFYGIPPVEDESHPMYGLYRFKTGFGGDIIHRIGSIDIPFSFFYTAYSLAEKLRLFWFKKIKKLFVKKAS